MAAEKVTITAADVGELKIEQKPDTHAEILAKVPTQSPQILTAYCTNCKTDTPHSSVQWRSKEIVLACKCGHFIKFPAGADVGKLIAEHKRQNTLPPPPPSEEAGLWPE